MIGDSCWLPKLENIEDYDNNYFKYQEALYKIFVSDFINSYPLFFEKRVNIRKYPIELGKEEAFFHVTCQDYVKSGEREFDFNRCKRIRWVRAFIENYNCDSTQCNECEGVKVWKEPYKNTIRVHILLEEERYTVIVESREEFWLLITAFYIEWDHSLRKQLKHYEQYKENMLKNNTMDTENTNG